MSISELSVLISAEPDAKLANKDQVHQNNTEDGQISGSDFFSQLQSANNAVETPNKKSNTAEQRDPEEVKLDQDEIKKEQDKPEISGDDMLAQINAANNLDTSVKTTSTDKPATSVIDLLDKYAQEKLDPGLVKVNAPRPIDAVTPIIDPPLEDDSQDAESNSVSDLLDKYSKEQLDPELVKVNAPRPIDAVTPIIDSPLEDDSSENKLAVTSDKTVIAEAIGKEVNYKGDPGDAVTPIVDKVNSDKEALINSVTTAQGSDQVKDAAESTILNKEPVNPKSLEGKFVGTATNSENESVKTEMAKSSHNGEAKVLADVTLPSSTGQSKLAELDDVSNTEKASSVANTTESPVVDKTLTQTPDVVKVLKEAVTATQTQVNSAADKPSVVTSAIAKSPDVTQAVQTLLKADESTSLTDDKLLASLSTEQRTQLQTQAESLPALGATPQSISVLKQTIAQFIVSNNDANPAIKNVTVNTTMDTTQLSDEIASLSAPEKQVLAKQLNQFIATEKPQGAVLNKVNAALAELEGKSVTTIKEPQLNAQTLTQAANSTPVESSKAAPVHSAAGSALSQEQANKQSAVQSIVKEQVIVDKDNAEALTPRDTAVTRTNQLFAQITTATNQITSSVVTGMNEVIEQRYQQEFTDMQVLNAQQTTATSQSKQINVDPTMLQALNIVKSDAAKLLQERVSALLNINNKEAEIRLDPPEMGSMQIRIRSDAEQAQINFVVQNQQAKEALEQSMPKLREMLAEQGIELGESSIQQGDSQENMAEQQQQNAQGQLANNAENDDESTDIQASTNNIKQQSSSSIDYYA
ncbi:MULTISPECIES: flagellar hook-length control protein FliK [unclassified Pseudoalteromonas]|uniref:flagellar hook-length control protein FliK n=1 Tax=unclassified Pseudoalteromonas TaxID=194690 RepID=UPI0025B48F5E|nr:MULTISPECIES: flagellar hook-length control protein FliK [unclassified Pseudoalteromonas]MDN3378189.1 flagellar hook-length control protein FliK [Pseudoalteromonas sp. APC 3893]MDN3388553.1 flagellar hook-length control protein FliK [Pseudoalteromonas sp. APC 4017]